VGLIKPTGLVGLIGAQRDTLDLVVTEKNDFEQQ